MHRTDQGIPELWEFKFEGGLVTPKFSAAPRDETMRWTPNVFEVQERAGPCHDHAKFNGA